MSGLPDTRAVSISTAGYEDGLGRRSVRFDREVGGMLECLHLRPELWAFESNLRTAADAIASLDDERFVRVRAIERGPHGLAVVSEVVPGQRLLDIIETRQRDDAGAFGIDASIGFLLQVMPALSTLHTLSIAHGTLAPGRLMVTGTGQVVLLDGIYGAALERLNLSRVSMWANLGVLAQPFAGAPRFDRQADLAQAALCGLVLAVGRSVSGAGDLSALAPLINELREVAEIRAGATFAAKVQGFFQSLLPATSRRAALTADQAALEAEQLADMIGEEGCHSAFSQLARFEATIARSIPSPLELPEHIEDDFETEAVEEELEALEDVLPEIKAEPVIAPALTARYVAPRAADPPPPLQPVISAPVPVPVAIAPPAPAPVVIVPPEPAPVVTAPPQAAPVVIVPVPPAPVAPAATVPVPVQAMPAAVAPAPILPLTPVEPIPVVPPAAAFSPVPVPPPVSLPPAAPPPVFTPIPVQSAPVPPAPAMFVPSAPVAAPQPISVFAPPPPAPPATPTIGFVTASPVPLKVRQEQPSGFTPARVEGEPPVRALPFVDRAIPPLPSAFPWKLAGAAIIVLAVGIMWGRTYLQGNPDVTPVLDPPKPVAAAGIAPTMGTTGGLAIDTQPSGAKITLDGVDIGAAPIKLDSVQPGKHVVVVTTDSATIRRTIRVEAGRVLSLDVPVYSGWVSVFSPIPLDIAEEGKTLGNTDTGKILLPPGRHLLTLSNTEFGFSDTRTVEIQPGEERPLNIEPKGIVNVNAHPWAEVWIDGKKAGDTPIANLAVLMGTRTFTFKHPQYGERRLTVTVTSTAAAVSVDFTKP